MIRSLQDVADQAREKGPMRVAVLAPEDEEFMLAVKRSWQKGFIEPVLIGNRERIEQVSAKVEFDISCFETITNDDRQAIANLGIGMIFSGELPIASKGQIPTSYIYRSIIREEAKAGSGMHVSVISFGKSPDSITWLPLPIPESISNQTPGQNWRSAGTLFLFIAFLVTRSLASPSFPDNAKSAVRCPLTGISR